MPKIAAPLLPLLLAVLLCGCGRSFDRADLVFINGAEPEPLDPAAITAQATGRIGYALFEGLTSFGPTAKPEPGVAERWEISPDGLHYTFHLRHDSTWSNGEPVTARDFVYSWTRTLTPATASEYASQLYYVKNAKAFNDGKLLDATQLGVRAADDFTLEVTLENPTPYFLDLCAFSTLLPVHRATVERHADWATKPEHFMGNGPYLLKEWRLLDRVRMVKNPHYWNAANVAKMKSIDVMPSSKPDTAFNLYYTHVADLMMDKGLTPNALIGELKKRPDFHASPFLGNYFIRFNVTRPAFKDPRVRQAFGLAIDKKRLTEKITRAGEVPAFSFTPPGTGDGYEPPPGLVYNPDRARELMAAAGYPGGRGFPFFDYLYKDAGMDKDIAVEVQGMLMRELGVHMQLKAVEWTVYLAMQSALDFDLCRSSWVADYNDPNTFLNMFVTNDGNNRTGWSNAAYDHLIEAAQSEVDQGKRYGIFREAERMLVTEEAPICPLYYYVGIQFYDPEKLGGIVPNLLDEHPLKHIYWKKPR